MSSPTVSDLEAQGLMVLCLDEDHAWEISDWLAFHELEGLYLSNPVRELKRALAEWLEVADAPEG